MRFACPALIGLAFAIGLIGCATPEITPIVPVGVPYVDDHNPVYIPLGRESYGTVFENVLTVLSDFGFNMEYSNRYDGRIETLPRSSPGLLLFLKPGSPDLYVRTLATAQSYRNRITVQIHPAEQGGYFIEVIARKELEDMPRPIRSTIGASIFRIETNLDRDYDVVNPFRADPGWIYKGRDAALEQEIIRRMKKLM